MRGKTVYFVVDTNINLFITKYQFSRLENFLGNAIKTRYKFFSTEIRLEKNPNIFLVERPASMKIKLMDFFTACIDLIDGQCRFNDFPMIYDICMTYVYIAGQIS